MPIRNPKPTSPGPVRHLSGLRRDHRIQPEKSLTEGLKNRAGATRMAARRRATAAAARSGSTGRSTSSAARTGSRRRSPTSSTTDRSAYIALLHYADGEKRYILAPQRLRVGTTVQSGPERRHPRWQRLPLANMPPAPRPQRRAASPAAAVSSAAPPAPVPAAGEGRRLRDAPPAVGRDADGPGRVPRDRRHDRQRGSPEREDRQGGPQAPLGVRPQTRGTAMNPVDHPHGGGEGSTTPGRHPVTPWGVPTLGYRTRQKNKNRTSTSSAAGGGVRSGESIEQEGPVRRGAPDGADRGDEHLGEKRMVRTWSRTSTIFPRWSGTRSPSTTAASTCPCSSRSRWSAQAWGVRADAALSRPCGTGKRR